MSGQSLKTNSSKFENLFLRRTVFGGGEHTLFVRRKRHYMQMFPKSTSEAFIHLNMVSFADQ